MCTWTRSHEQSPLGSTRAHFPDLAPLGLDSGTRGYNQRCRDTVALPPPSPRGGRASGGKSRYMAEPARARRGRRDPGRGWALRAFINTPASVPRPSVTPPPVHGPGPLRNLGLLTFCFSDTHTGGSASILGTSVYRRSKLRRRIVRRPKRARSDGPTTRDRGSALTLVRLE